MAPQGGEYMSENSSTNDHLKILEEFFGFLAVILALIIPIFWEDFQESDDPQTQLLYIFFIEILILGLMMICAFYFARYSGKDLFAEFIGTSLFIILSLSIYIMTFPFLEIIRVDIINIINLKSSNLFATVLATIFLVFLWLISLGIAIFGVSKILQLYTEKIKRKISVNKPE